MNESRLSAPKATTARIPQSPTISLFLAAALTVSFWCNTALTAPIAGPSSQSFPKIRLGQRANSSRAIQILGDRLPSVAQAYGISATSLHQMLLVDRTLHVDDDGRLHYVEEVPTTFDAPQAHQALAPLTDTFALHSKPGASKTIYLDFNGHVLTGTAWNSGVANLINAPAWTTDADPHTFSDSERTSIQYIWQRVAEDFAPFDVDVTTELASEGILTRSTSSDSIYGVRVLISAISIAVGFPTSGGVSYVGTFNDVGDFYKPSLVFPERLGNSEKNIAEAASHEAGHALGLNHDGRISPSESYYPGQGVWAPIMGVGYSKSLVQWSKGEYASANNTEDDLAGIASYLGYRADDHGNTIGTATYLPTSTTVSVAGIITTRNDIDVFGISSGPGELILRIDPQSRSANLDILAQLHDANGNLIATSNPLGALNAGFDVAVEAGTYFLSIRGAGEGDPTTSGYTSYGSLGHYLVTGTIPSSGHQSPVAVASASPEIAPVGSTITFNGAGSFDPDGGPIASYHWSFSDGATANTAIVARELAIAGTFTATLTVTDTEGSTASTTLPYIVNQAPVAVASASPEIVPLGGTIIFDGAGSHDPDGSPIATYHWSFSDGATANTATVTRELTNGGNFTATLTVTDDKGSTASTTLPYIVNRTPVAVASASPEIVPVGGTIIFDGAGSHDPDGSPIATYHWSFSDGATANTATVTRELTTAGTFTATLTVTDDKGSAASTTLPYSVNQGPVAVASATPEIVPVGGTITFDGAGSFDPDGGPITSYHWSFSDGATANTATVARELTNGGIFTATLTVTDDKGSTASTTLPYSVNQGPVAVASASPEIVPVGGIITFDGAGSFDPDGGPITNYHWSFSDGATADTATVDRELTAAGTFTATLTVTDNKGFTASTTVPYSVNQGPVAVASASPEMIPVGGIITFDGAGSFDPDGGSITSYHWNFSDGATANTATVARELSSAGTFTATLTVTDDKGSTASTTLPYVVNQGPVAIASASPKIVLVDGTITFDGAESFDPDGGPIAIFHWSFSDGATADTATVDRELTTAGTFTATLTVTDKNGSTASTTLPYIVNQAPVAAFTTSAATSGTAPFAVGFDASSSFDPDTTDSIASYHWDFGDGTTGTGGTIIKTYQTPGTFTALLTVTDTRGATSTSQVLILVASKPSVLLKINSIILTSAVNRKGIRMAQASVKVTDLHGVAVSDVFVSGRWSGETSSNSSATTGTAGIANMVSRSLKSSGTVTFTITSISRSGYTYDPSDSETSMSGTFEVTP